ncbi:hypothetical protein GGI23_001399, partial [Coemansia sp. RSA 2559]
MFGKYSFRTSVNKLFYAAVLLSDAALAVHRDDFKTSQDITFYLRHHELAKAMEQPTQTPPYRVVDGS